MKEAVQAGIVFSGTVSDGILTKDVIPRQFVLSVEDTDKKSNGTFSKDVIPRQFVLSVEDTDKKSNLHQGDWCGANSAATCCQNQRPG